MRSELNSQALDIVVDSLAVLLHNRLAQDKCRCWQLGRGLANEAVQKFWLYVNHCGQVSIFDIFFFFNFLDLM